MSAANSRMAAFLQTYPLKSKSIIAHVRKATIGEVCLENAHPFVRQLWGRHWVFAHNGDLKDYFPRLHPLPAGGQHGQRARLLLADAGVGQVARRRSSVAELTLTLRELAP